MSKQTRPHSPAGTRLEPPDEGGIYRIIIPSESRPGRAHELRVLYTGEAVGCTCEGHAAFLDYRATRHTPGTPLARRDCWHMEAAADLLAHHLDPPPADHGGGLDRDGRRRAFERYKASQISKHPFLADDHELWRAYEREFVGVDDEGPPADPGGATLDRAQRDVDAETRAWAESPELAGLTASGDAAHEPRTLDDLVAAGGDAWLVSRSSTRVTLTCAACHGTRIKFESAVSAPSLLAGSEEAAAAWLANGGVCGCGGAGPTPPAPGAARKPLDDCLHDLYGD
jgi:mono/diheme cytochrome c family protein